MFEDDQITVSKLLEKDCFLLASRLTFISFVIPRLYLILTNLTFFSCIYYQALEHCLVKLDAPYVTLFSAKSQD